MNITQNLTAPQAAALAALFNQITGPNAGGPRQFPIRTSLAIRAGQFWR